MRFKEPTQIENILTEVINDTKQVGREIYYAMSFLDNTHPSRANLTQALKLLGINGPQDVDLSDRVLGFKKEN